MRLESYAITTEDYKLLKYLIETVINLNHELEKKNTSIRRLRKLFNIKTEKLHTLCQQEKKDKEENNDDNKDDGHS
ncbi:MAG: hypothetical protein JXB88_12425 [Spirochaetales bacterium]|nr:hypothetical protein [Spirochaetales bacterium]